MVMGSVHVEIEQFGLVAFLVDAPVRRVVDDILPHLVVDSHQIRALFFLEDQLFLVLLL